MMSFKTSSDHIGLQFEEKMSKIKLGRYFLSQNIKLKVLQSEHKKVTKQF